MIVGVRAQCCAVVILFAFSIEARAAGQPLSVWPLGDSLTYGWGSATAAGGFRTNLALGLYNAGYSPVFLGSDVQSASYQLAGLGMTHHDGHPGYRIDDLAKNIDGVAYPSYNYPNNGGYWLPGGNGTGRSAIYPDVITLFIGNNDIGQRYDPNDMGKTESDAEFLAHMEGRLDALVNQIVNDRPTAKLFVSGLIPILDSRNALVLQYNDAIRNVIVPKYAGMGDSVYFVDQYHNFVDGNGDFIPYMQPDGSHPILAGYNLMGDTWAKSILSVLTPPQAEVLVAAEGADVPEPISGGLVAGLALLAFSLRRGR